MELECAVFRKIPHCREEEIFGCIGWLSSVRNIRCPLFGGSCTYITFRPAVPIGIAGARNIVTVPYKNIINRMSKARVSSSYRDIFQLLEPQASFVKVLVHCPEKVAVPVAVAKESIEGGLVYVQGRLAGTAFGRAGNISRRPCLRSSSASRTTAWAGRCA